MTPNFAKLATSKPWRDVLPVHPAAELFPMMSQDELRALGEDIKKNGLQTRIAVWQAASGRPWFLVDGRNRLDAAELVGLSVQFIKGLDVTVKIGGHLNAVDDLTSLDPYEYVISANVHRRHLTPEQKRDVIAALLKANPGKSDRRIAKEADSNRTTVGQIRKELEDTGTCQSVDTRTDSKGRRQQAHKPPQNPAIAAAVERAVSRSQESQRTQALVSASADTARAAPPAQQQPAAVTEDEPAQDVGTFPAYFGSCHGGRVVTERTSTKPKAKADRAAVKQPKATVVSERYSDFALMIEEECERLPEKQRADFLLYLRAAIDGMLHDANAAVATADAGSP